MKPDKWPISKIVEIHWRDANFLGGWGSVDSYRKRHDTAPCVSVGYVLTETKDAITIIQSQAMDNEDVDAALAIPKGWIVKVKVLRK